ncbi:unnamed protein product [Ectocarpus fasciculatus]
MVDVVGTLVASAPLVRAASHALKNASDRVARAMAIRCLQRLPVPLEGTLLNSVTDANILAMCHAMGPQALAALVCSLRDEKERWGYRDAPYAVAVLLDNLGVQERPPGSLIDHKADHDSGLSRVFNLLQEQPLAESWTLVGLFQSHGENHLLLKGDGFEYATVGLLSQPAYYVLAGSHGMPAVGGPPDLDNLLLAYFEKGGATNSVDVKFKEGISVVHKIVKMASRAYEELGRPEVISQEWLQQRCMAGNAIVPQEDTPCHSILAVLQHVCKMGFHENIALASLEDLFLAWVGSASSVKTKTHPQSDGLVSSCIGANCGVEAAVVLPGLRQSKINVYPSGQGMQVVYLPGFNTAVILPGGGELKVDRVPQSVGRVVDGGGMLLPFLVKVLKSGILKESTQPACRTLAREIRKDLLAVISPVSEVFLRSFTDTRLPRLSECFMRNPDLSEGMVGSVMQWLGVRWLEGQAGDYTGVLRNGRIAFEEYLRTSSLSCEVDCPQNREGGLVVTLPDGRLGLVAALYNDKATRVLPLVDTEGRHVKCGVHQLKGNKVYRCTAWEPVSKISATLIERPLYVG